MPTRDHADPGSPVYVVRRRLGDAFQRLDAAGALVRHVILRPVLRVSRSRRSGAVRPRRWSSSLPLTEKQQLVQTLEVIRIEAIPVSWYRGVRERASGAGPTDSGTGANWFGAAVILRPAFPRRGRSIGSGVVHAGA